MKTFGALTFREEFIFVGPCSEISPLDEPLMIACSSDTRYIGVFGDFESVVLNFVILAFKRPYFHVCDVSRKTTFVEIKKRAVFHVSLIYSIFATNKINLLKLLSHSLVPEIYFAHIQIRENCLNIGVN